VSDVWWSDAGQVKGFAEVGVITPRSVDFRSFNANGKIDKLLRPVRSKHNLTNFFPEYKCALHLHWSTLIIFWPFNFGLSFSWSNRCSFLIFLPIEDNVTNLWLSRQEWLYVVQSYVNICRVQKYVEFPQDNIFQISMCSEKNVWGFPTRWE
jgi:hypothetical protein